MKQRPPVVALTDLVCRLMAVHPAGLAQSIISLDSQPIRPFFANILRAITIFRELLVLHLLRHRSHQLRVRRSLLP